MTQHWIVVDEAGMMDLHTAYAIAHIAARTGAGVAMIGDHLQLNPVGHSGAMALAHHLTQARTELSAVHRFRKADGSSDLEYAALSLRLRDPDGAADAAAIVDELAERGRVHVVKDSQQAQTALVDAWFAARERGQSVAITTSTNEEAQAINDEIQRRRVARGQLSDAASAYGQHDQRILVGDIIQTRQNDANNDVANRDDWTVTRVHRDGSVTATRRGDLTDKSVTLTAAYLATHTHLAYASTAHGIQGATVDVALTGPDVAGAGLYVGMTRGRYDNTAYVVAATEKTGRTELAEALLRGQPETTLADTQAALSREIAAAAKPAQPERPYKSVPNLEQRLAQAERTRTMLSAGAEPKPTDTDEQRQAREKVWEQLAKNAALIDELHAEQAARAALPADVAAAEAAERAQTARTTPARRAPEPSTAEQTLSVDGPGFGI